MVVSLLLFLTACASPRPGDNFMENLARFPRDGYYIEDVPPLGFNDRDRGSAPLTSVFRFWGIRMSQDDVDAALAGTGSDLATIQERMIQLSGHQGLWAFAEYGNRRKLEERIRSDVPVIVMLQDTGDLHSRRYAVVNGFNRESLQIACQAGGGQPTVYSVAEFDRLWRPVQRWMLVVAPAEYPRWDMSMLEHVSRARFLDNQGLRDQALVDMNAALQMEPDNPDLLVAAGNLFRSAGRPGDAEDMYRTAFGRDEMNARVCNNLAYLLAEQGIKLDEAESFARRASILEPSNPAALDTLGFVLMKQGSFDEAAEVLEKARLRARYLPPDSRMEILIRLARAYVAAGQAHLARQVVRDLVRAFPEASLPADLETFKP